VKKSKAQALKSWDRQKLDPMADQLIAILKNQKATDSQWREGFGIPHPSTYLNNQRWEDEIQNAPKPRNTAAQDFADSIFGPIDGNGMGQAGGEVWGQVDVPVVGSENQLACSGGMDAKIIPLLGKRGSRRN